MPVASTRTTLPVMQWSRMKDLVLVLARSAAYPALLASTTASTWLAGASVDQARSQVLTISSEDPILIMLRASPT